MNGFIPDWFFLGETGGRVSRTALLPPVWLGYKGWRLCQRHGFALLDLPLDYHESSRPHIHSNALLV